jgi:enediyne biosynthesis protein E4
MSQCVRILICIALLASLPEGKEKRLARNIPRQPVNAPRFTDITATTNISFRHASAGEQKYIVMGGGVLLLDFDRDGWQDIFFTNAPTVRMFLQKESARSALYQNNHDGTFTDVTEHARVGLPGLAMGGAVGDFDNDSWPDIYVTCLGRNVLYRNNQDGTFSEVTERAGVGDDRWSTGAAFADYDQDGFLDLFVANYVDLKLTDLSSLATVPFCPYRNLSVQCGPRGLKGAGDTLYHNNGDGTFTDVSQSAGLDDPTGYFGLGVLWSDLDNDGRPDLYVANDATPNFLYHNLGNGRFEEIGFFSGTALSTDGTAQAGMGVAACDYLHSGQFSLHVTNFADEYNTLYRNDGQLAFTDATHSTRLAAPTLPYLGWGTACTDLDNDGWPDIFTVNGHVYPQADHLFAGQKYRQRMFLFLNSRDGTFRDDSASAGAALSQLRVSRGAAFGDLDNDGDIDVVVENIDGKPTVLRNESRPRNWITFRLVGVRSNRLAIGARVKVVSGSLLQVEEVHSGGSYLSQNDLRVHFGLDAATRVDRVEIRWPSGATEKLSDLNANRFYTIREGNGIIETSGPVIDPTKRH